MGKTSLFANLATDYSDKQKKLSDQKAVVLHFVGIAPGSSSVDLLLKRLWYECLNCSEDLIPSDIVQLKLSLGYVLKQASKLIEQRGLKRLVIFIDSLNQLDNENEAMTIAWLPNSVPYNVRFLVSLIPTNVDIQELAASSDLQINLLDIDLLAINKRKNVVAKFLKKYGKVLTEQQMNTLVAKRDSGLPLWLELACEQLRVYGHFATFGDKVQSLGDDLKQLIWQVMDRLVAENAEMSEMTRSAWSLLAVSRFGLTESEMRHLLAVRPLVPTDLAVQDVTPNQCISQETVSVPYRNLLLFCCFLSFTVRAKMKETSVTRLLTCLDQSLFQSCLQIW